MSRRGRRRRLEDCCRLGGIGISAPGANAITSPYRRMEGFRRRTPCWAGRGTGIADVARQPPMRWASPMWLASPNALGIINEISTIAPPSVVNASQPGMCPASSVDRTIGMYRSAIAL